MLFFFFLIGIKSTVEKLTFTGKKTTKKHMLNQTNCTQAPDTDIH